MSEENKSIAEIGDERIKKLEALVGKLVEAIKNVPTDEYDRAMRNGCDSNGAWDSFCDAMGEWEKTALSEAQKMKEIPNG